MKILFLPALYVRGNPRRYDFYAGNPKDINHQPDEVLLDEIANALLRATGVEKRVDEELEAIDYLPTEKNEGRRFLVFGNATEFFSILIVNIYVSEKNQRNFVYQPPPSLGSMTRGGPLPYVLRKDHHSGWAHIPLPQPRRFSAHPRIRQLVRQFMRPPLDGMCAEIAMAPAAFNPFRDILIERDPVKTLSHYFRKYDDSHASLEFFQDTTARLVDRLGEANLERLFKQARGESAN